MMVNLLTLCVLIFVSSVASQRCGTTCTTTDKCGGGTFPCPPCPNGYSCFNNQYCTAFTFPQCAPGTTTTIRGVVRAPNQIEPVPNVFVFVPGSQLQPFVSGVSQTSCSEEGVSGNPLVYATTSINGSFVITNMPSGTNIPIVIQSWKWRRVFNIATTACADHDIGFLDFPRTRQEGDIPLIAFVTGYVDCFECMFRKIGISDSEFSGANGPGRIRLYNGVGSPGATIPGAINETYLWGSQQAINQYDMVFFACQGSEFLQQPQSQQNVINYANVGGRLFFTHYGYVWLFNAPPFSSTANWSVPGSTPINQIADINQDFPGGTNLAIWLQIVVGGTLGQVQVSDLRSDFTEANPPSLTWIYTTQTPIRPLIYTFSAPVGSPISAQCGQVFFADVHVANCQTSPSVTFPDECTSGAMGASEYMMEFFIFTLSGFYIAPTTCAPTTSCALQNATCGLIDNGCEVESCGRCPGNLHCSCLSCVATWKCTKETCKHGNCMGNECRCFVGWTGVECDIETCDQCWNGECMGTYCNCTNGWTGDYCDIIDITPESISFLFHFSAAAFPVLIFLAIVAQYFITGVFKASMHLLLKIVITLQLIFLPTSINAYVQATINQLVSPVLQGVFFGPLQFGYYGLDGFLVHVVGVVFVMVFLCLLVKYSSYKGVNYCCGNVLFFGYGLCFSLFMLQFVSMLTKLFNPTLYIVTQWNSHLFSYLYLLTTFATLVAIFGGLYYFWLHKIFVELESIAPPARGFNEFWAFTPSTIVEETTEDDGDSCCRLHCHKDHPEHYNEQENFYHLYGPLVEPYAIYSRDYDLRKLCGHRFVLLELVHQIIFTGIATATWDYKYSFVVLIGVEVLWICVIILIMPFKQRRLLFQSLLSIIVVIIQLILLQILLFKPSVALLIVITVLPIAMMVVIYLILPFIAKKLNGNGEEGENGLVDGQDVDDTKTFGKADKFEYTSFSEPVDIEKEIPSEKSPLINARKNTPGNSVKNDIITDNLTNDTNNIVTDDSIGVALDDDDAQ